MSRLVYDEAELLQSHGYSRPHIEAGKMLHGGFNAEDRYVPPRLLHRGPAVEGWIEALRSRGGDLLPADSSLLEGIRYPSTAQQKLLVREGLGQTFWNMLTITGHIEARGRALADLDFPDLQTTVLEDISGMGIGHLNKGMLTAHGLDEGGEPEKGIGGHDVMWFALRDLAFGETDYAEPAIPEIVRPESEAAEISGLPLPILRTIYLLANVLMIEFRAERVFSFVEDLLRDRELFTGRRAEADHAAEIVNRIRADEEIHVSSLRLFLGELCSVTLKLNDGRRVPGHEVVDALWNGIVHWATLEQPKLAAEQQRQMLTERILAHPDGQRVLEEFNRLEESP